MAFTVKAYKQSTPIAGEFAISREVKTTADSVIVEITKDGITAMGECVPLKRYHHNQDSVLAEIAQIQEPIKSRDVLQDLLPASPARNAIDCALWDWEIKQSGQTPDLKPLKTAYTLSLSTPDNMAENAKNHAEFTILKMKMKGDDGDLERIKAVKTVVPQAQLILDANEAWSMAYMDNIMAKLLDFDVVLIEQPLPEGADDDLRNYHAPIAIAADESCHTADDLIKLKDKYQVVNIKLDKTGGLTHALVLKEKAMQMGFDIMVGCMASTSLAIYPAMFVAQGAQYCDLDGALLLKKDPYRRVFYQNGQVVSA